VGASGSPCAVAVVEFDAAENVPTTSAISLRARTLKVYVVAGIRSSIVVEVPVPVVVLIGEVAPARKTLYPVIVPPSVPTSEGATQERSTVPGGENGAVEVKLVGAVGGPGDFLFMLLEASPGVPLSTENWLRALTVNAYV
jgi:hypothetical protein